MKCPYTANFIFSLECGRSPAHFQMGLEFTLTLLYLEKCLTNREVTCNVLKCGPKGSQEGLATKMGKAPGRKPPLCHMGVMVHHYGCYLKEQWLKSRQKHAVLLSSYSFIDIVHSHYMKSSLFSSSACVPLFFETMRTF